MQFGFLHCCGATDAILYYSEATPGEVYSKEKETVYHICWHGKGFWQGSSESCMVNTVMQKLGVDVRVACKDITICVP